MAALGLRAHPYQRCFHLTPCSSAASASITRWPVPPVNIQRLHRQHLLQATAHGKMVLPTLLLNFHPLAFRLAKLFVTHPPHLIFMSRMAPDLTCLLGTDCEAKSSPL